MDENCPDTATEAIPATEISPIVSRAAVHHTHTHTHTPLFAPFPSRRNTLRSPDATELASIARWK